MSRKKGGSPPGQRQLRVGEALRHALVRALERGEVRDPAAANVSITVTQVSLSPDLRNAIAYVTPLGGAGAAALVQALNRAAPYLRSLVAREVQLRFAPQLRFALDTTFEEAGKIDRLLREIAAGGGGGRRD
jgi:ribosome-binding factor A